MFSKETDCILRKRAGQLARDKDLLNQRKEISCPHVDGCDGTICELSKNPQTRTIYLNQSDEVSVPSGSERFFRKLEGWELLKGK